MNRRMFCLKGKDGTVYPETAFHEKHSVWPYGFPIVAKVEGLAFANRYRIALTSEFVTEAKKRGWSVVPVEIMEVAKDLSKDIKAVASDLAVAACCLVSPELGSNLKTAESHVHDALDKLGKIMQKTGG